VIKVEEWPALMGTLKWHFTPWIEEGGTGNGREM
jgi:hypothetical protein